MQPRVLEDEAAAGVALERGLAGGDAVVHIEAGRERGEKEVEVSYGRQQNSRITFLVFTNYQRVSCNRQYVESK